MEWAQILVIILSVFLAIFLIVGIVLVIMLIRVTRQIKKVTGSAERTVATIEGMATKANSLTSASVLFNALMKQFKKTGKK